MRVITRDSLEWKEAEGCSKALVHSEKLGESQLEVSMLEVGAGQTLKPQTHEKSREFVVVVYSSGAQIRLGTRVFRPLAGQIFEREAGEAMEIVNDSSQPTRFFLTRIGNEPE